MANKKLNIENEIYHFWLDHLEVYGTFKEEKELFDNLDFDNSNYWELDDYTFTKNEVKKFIYKIIFSKDNYSLFAYYKWIPRSEKQPVATKDYITIYSTAFKLLEYEEILWFLEYYIDLKHCRRFDICIDLKINIEILLKYFINYETWREYKKNWKLETRYIWELKNSINKRQIIRIYDKNKDIIAKKKIKLYENYLTEKDITRVELEIRQELAKNISYKNIFDNYLLFWIFKNYLCKNTKLFDKIKIEKITLFKPKIKLGSESFQSLYYKTQRKNIFLWHAKTIFNMWFCPVRILIWEWYVQEKTKIVLWIDKIEDLIAREKKVIEQAKEDRYIRNNLGEVLSNYYKYGN